MGDIEEHPDDNDQDNETAESAKASAPWWWYAVGVAVLAACGLFVFQSQHTEPTSEDNSRDAQRACEKNFIPSRLKAPATAKFSGESVSHAGETYTVTGAVDSENGFGALIRASFTCVMHSSDDQWVLDSASVDG